MWFNTNTQAVYRSHAEIRAAFVNTSFPSELHDSVLLDFGVCALLPSPIPEHDPAVQIAEEGQPLQIDGLWTQQWTVRALTPEELQARVPKEVTALQALLAIDAADLALPYETWANDPARTFVERAFITRAQVWRRDDPTLHAAATAMGLPDAYLDDLFTLAATL